MGYRLKYGEKKEKSTIFEIERYLANYVQVFTLEIGELKMQEVKTRYQQELGNRFDIKKQK
jgi:uncharacterized protein (DUF885 family)